MSSRSVARATSVSAGLDGPTEIRGSISGKINSENLREDWYSGRYAANGERQRSAN